ncbi:MAG: site-2 protease family protein [Candidatus Magasanikbacteria bacterium]
MVIALQIVILLFSVVIHEVSHGYMARHLGDRTAERAGRLTLNPIKHLDMWGSIIIPALLVVSGTSFIIGWAKPVPYNPNQLHKDPKYGPLKVALAGPASNIVLALIFGGILRFFHGFLPQLSVAALGFVVVLNILLAVFNLVPVPPLDGSKILTILLPHPYSSYVQQIGIGGIFFVFLFLILFGGVIFGVTTYLSQIIMGPQAWQALGTLMGGA